MVSTTLNFCSISHKKTQHQAQKHALKISSFLALLCSYDIFNLGYRRKVHKRWRTSNSDEVCFNYDQLFQPIQAPPEHYVRVTQKISSFCNEPAVFRQLQVTFSTFELQTVAVTVHHSNQIFCISFAVHIYFSSTILSCPL